MAKKVIIPLPDKDFYTTEVSIPWKHFVEAGLHVTFSTETGQIGQTDPRLLTGVIFGQLGAKQDAIAAYRDLEKTVAFRHPIPYENIDPQEYDLLLLPGGHHEDMVLAVGLGRRVAVGEGARIPVRGRAVRAAKAEERRPDGDPGHRWRAL